MRKLELKETKGITLVALVVTIIILIILAGVSISLVLGDDGIMQKARNAKTNTEISEAKELAKMDIMDWITDKTINNQDTSLDDAKVKGILTGKSYVKEAKASSFITTKGEYEIPYSELYTASNTISATTLPARTYTAGEEVELGGEKFFVLEDDGINVKLLSKYCLSMTENIQVTKDVRRANYGRSFASTNYWSSDFTSDPFDLQGAYLENHPLASSETEANNAIMKAQSYGIAKGAIGRLMTYEEANAIQTGNDTTMKNILWGKWNDDTQPAERHLNWWLGSAKSTQYVSVVYGEYSVLGSQSTNTVFGVRPVLIVSKS